jgi:thioredoxin 1
VRPIRVVSRVFVGSCLVAATACGGGSVAPTTPSGASNVVELTLANFNDEVLDNPGVVLVEFYLPTCPVCQSMAPTVEQVADDYVGRAVVGRVDAGVEQELGAIFNVTQVPSFFVFKAGTPVDSRVGGMAREDLSAMIAVPLGS